MTIEVTEDELRMIVAALRGAEKNSRTGFAKRLTQDMDKADVSDDELIMRRRRAIRVFGEFVALRAKLADHKPVEV